MPNHRSVRRPTDSIITFGKKGRRTTERRTVDTDTQQRMVTRTKLATIFESHRLELLLFALALGIRLIYLLQSADAPSFALPLVDSEIYDRAARDLMHGAGLTEAFFYQPFFYPLYLALVYTVTGSSILAAKLIQALLGALTVLCVASLARARFDRRTGLAAGLMTAFYGPLFFFEGELLAAGWAALWAVVVVGLFGAAAERRSLSLCAAAGLCGGLAVITRPTFLPFVAVTSLWVLWLLVREGRHSPSRIFGAVVGGFLLVTLPVALLSLETSGKFSFVPASGGLNLHIGNNPDPCETLTIRPGQSWHELVTSPAREGVGGLWEEDRFFRSRVTQFVKTQPAAFVRGIVAKTAAFFSSREIPRNIDIYHFRRWSSLLGAAVWKVGAFGFPFGLFFPLAILGVIVGWRRLSTPLLLFLVLYPPAVIVVFVSSRYRVPIIPVLAVPAAVGLVWLMDTMRQLAVKRLALAGGVIAGALLLCVIPGPFCQEEDLQGEYWFVVAAAQLRNNEQIAAIESLRRAVEVDPNYFEAQYQLGTVLFGGGDVASAIQHFEQAVAARPDMAVVHSQLGLALAQMGRTAEARHHMARASELDPDNVSNLINVGVLMARAGDLNTALWYFRRAVSLDPKDQVARSRLEQVQRDLAEGNKQ